MRSTVRRQISVTPPAGTAWSWRASSSGDHHMAPIWRQRKGNYKKRMGRQRPIKTVCKGGTEPRPKLWLTDNKPALQRSKKKIVEKKR
jgi:hypothetical protein